MNTFIDVRNDDSENVRYDSSWPIYIRRGLLSYFIDYRAQAHWHNDIEFIAVLSGTMDYNIDGSLVTLGPGDGLFVNSRRLHFGFSDEKNECDFICILLNPILLCAYPDAENDFVLPVTENAALPYLLLHKSCAPEKKLIDMIRQMYEVKGRPGWELNVSGLFCEIWAQIYVQKPGSRAADGHGSTDSPAFKDMVTFIRQNFAGRITLADIASAGCMGESKCCALFAKYLRQTPNGYLTSYRIGRAAHMLVDTDLRVTEIAFACGFNGSSYFAEVFGRITGMTPGRYRAEKRRG